MRRLRWFLWCFLLSCGAAFGQTIPNGNIPLTNGQVWTLPQWDSAWQAKVDVNDGASTDETLTTPTIVSPTFSGSLTLPTGTTLTNPVITGGTSTSITLTSPAINSATISGPSITGGTITSSLLSGATVTGGGAVVGTTTSQTLTNKTLDLSTSSLINGTSNTVLGTLSGNVSQLNVPSCSNTDQTLQWTTGSGFGCVTLTIPTPGITVGTTTITGGTSGYLVFDNAGIVGAEAASGLSIATSQLTGTVSTAQGGLGANQGSASGIPLFTSGAVAMTATTGSGSVVLATSPTLVTPALGTPASGVATNLTGLPLSTGVTGNLPNANLATQTANTVLGALTATTPSGLSLPSCSSTNDALEWTTGTGFSCVTITAASSSLTIGSTPISGGTTGDFLTVGSGGVLQESSSGAPSMAIGGTVTGGTSGEFLYVNSSTELAQTTTTGSGSVVLATSPTLVTPALGTPASGTMTNVTGLPLSTGVTGTLPTANGGLGANEGSGSGVPLFATGAVTMTSTTGTGNFVRATSPTLVTPALGTPASGVATNLTGLPLTTGVTGTLPTANGGLGANEGSASGVPLFASGAVTMTATTGTGNSVLATSPTLVTPVLGTPTSVTLTNATGLPLSSGVTGNLPNANLTSEAANTVLGTLTATTPGPLSVPSCNSTNQALQWGSGSGFGCVTISGGGGGTPGGSTGQLQFNSSSAFAGNAGYTIVAAATCNGTTDTSTAINNAISAATANGGGLVLLPQGTCAIGATIVLQTGVSLVGAGTNATVIEGLSTFSPNSPMLETSNFSTLVGGNTAAGPYDFSVQNLTINGNKSGRGASGTSTGDGLDIYGFHYIVSRVQIINSPRYGLWSEWATSPTVPVSGTNVGMESFIYRVATGSNGSTGLAFEGPHDSYIDDTTSYLNGALGIYLADSSTYMASGTWLQGVHSYTNTQSGITISGSTIQGSDIESESGSADGIDITGGALLATNIITFNNTGAGLSIANTNTGIISGTTLSNVSSYQNKADGIDINGGGGSNVPTITLSNVATNDNTGWGFNACVSGTYSGNYMSVSGLTAQTNGGGGVQNCMQVVSYTGLMLQNNTGDGFASGYTGGQAVVSGVAIGNSTTDVAMGTLGASTMINMEVYTGSEACRSGTPAADSIINIGCTGGGTNNFLSAHPTEIDFFYNGVPTASAHLNKVFSRPATVFGSPLPTCSAQNGATGSTTVDLVHVSGGTSTTVGTLVFAASGSAYETCTATFSSPVTFAAGDVLEAEFPASADATLGNVAISVPAMQ